MVFVGNLTNGFEDFRTLRSNFRVGILVVSVTKHRTWFEQPEQQHIEQQHTEQQHTEQQHTEQQHIEQQHTEQQLVECVISIDTIDYTGCLCTNIPNIYESAQPMLLDNSRV
jgi:uncharacterized protein YjbK